MCYTTSTSAIWRRKVKAPSAPSNCRHWHLERFSLEVIAVQGFSWIALGKKRPRVAKISSQLCENNQNHIIFLLRIFRSKKMYSVSGRAYNLLLIYHKFHTFYTLFTTDINWLLMNMVPRFKHLHPSLVVLYKTLLFMKNSCILMRMIQLITWLQQHNRRSNPINTLWFIAK